MKYAVFSDIHGNLPALETLLNTVEDDCDGYICLGDIVGYGPDNDACLEKISKLKNSVILKGNHEEIFQTKDLSCCSDLAKEFFEHSFTFFSRSDLLPEQESFKSGDFSFCHSVKKNGRWLYLYGTEDIDISENICVGHTHYQTVFKQNGFSVVNVGSIGQNRQDKSKICYALFNSETKKITLHQKKYDLNQFLKILAEKGYPTKLSDYYGE